MQQPAHTPEPRRPYRRPTVTVYGDLRTVTLTSLSTNMNDPGNGSRSMT